MNILIIGSCVTNDVFSFVKHDHKLVAYFPRMSLATAFGDHAPGQVIEATKSQIESLTHRFWALNDLEKRLEKSLKNVAYDIIILDFIDDRLSLAVAENGSIFTLGDKARMNVASQTGCKIIPSGTSEYFELWQKGLATFASMVDHRKVFVNQVYWASETNDGIKHDKVTVDKNNNFLDEHYTYIQKHYDFNFIPFSRENLVSDEFHKWGKSPYHYDQSYYIEAMDAINSIYSDLVKNPL